MIAAKTPEMMVKLIGPALSILQAASAIGISEAEARRAEMISKIAPAARVRAKELGLDDN
jgi:hypothetical protein